MTIYSLRRYTFVILFVSGCIRPTQINEHESFLAIFYYFCINMIKYIDLSGIQFAELAKNRHSCLINLSRTVSKLNFPKMYYINVYIRWHVP